MIPGDGGDTQTEMQCRHSKGNSYFLNIVSRFCIPFGTFIFVTIDIGTGQTIEKPFGIFMEKRLYSFKIYQKHLIVPFKRGHFERIVHATHRASPGALRRTRCELIQTRLGLDRFSINDPLYHHKNGLTQNAS